MHKIGSTRNFNLIMVFCIIFSLFCLLVGCNIDYVYGNEKDNLSKEEGSSVIDSNKLLLEVVRKNRSFIDSTGEATRLVDYKIYGISQVYVDRYTFVDLNDDDTEELLVSVISDFDVYLVFRYDVQSKCIYGYLIDISSFGNVKVNGIFKGSGGAGLYSFLKIEFDNNNYYTNTVAICNDVTQIYQIDGKDVSREKAKDYVQSYDAIDYCQWQIIDQDFYNSTDEESSEPITKNPEGYIML